MNLRRVILTAASFSAGSLLGAAETGIEFSGVLTAEGKTWLALTDLARQTTTWIEPGGEFSGYIIDRYDSKDEAIFVKKGGEETRIGLVASRIVDAPARAGDADAEPTELDPASVRSNFRSLAAASRIRSNVRRLAAAARQYQREQGVSTVTYADLVGPDKLIKELKPVAGENYAALTFGPDDATIYITTGAGAVIAVPVAGPRATAATSPRGSAITDSPAPASSPISPGTTGGVQPERPAGGR